MKTWGYNREPSIETLGTMWSLLKTKTKNKEDIDLHSVSKLPASQFPNLPKTIILIPEQKVDHRYKFGSPFKIHL